MLPPLTSLLPSSLLSLLPSYFLPLLSSSSFLPCLLLILLYCIYYSKFRVFKYKQNENPSYPDRSKTDFLPGFPFGWYRLYDSDDLRPGVTHYKKCLGENLVVYRGYDKKVYALDAYCKHMGANLGVGGAVKNTNCVECPFHGWIYDGETGKCLAGNGKEARVADVYEYHDIKRVIKKDGCFFRKVGEEEVKVRTWVVVEKHHQLFLWYHPDESKRTTPLFELLDLSKSFSHLDYRGYGHNVLNNHLHEILENTGDYLHFHYVHGQLINKSDLIRFVWDMRWKPAEDPKLEEYMECSGKRQDKYRKDILREFINEKNKEYFSINGLENSISFPILGLSHYFFTGTAIHVGPSVVYFFFRSPVYDLVLSITSLPVDKYKQDFVVTLFCNKGLPYWLTAQIIYFEIGQISNDGLVWDQKINPERIYYNKFGPYDKFFIDWRNFYAKFFVDSYKKEEEQKEKVSNEKKLEW